MDHEPGPAPLPVTPFREAIENVLEGIELTLPIELADVLEVKARIDRELKDAVRVEAYHKIRVMVVSARLPGAQDPFFHRELEAK